MEGGNAFLTKTSERADLNQYWFSTPTIGTLVEEVVEAGGRAALVSTPSVYFSLPEAARERSHVLDFDGQWASDRGYISYDFNAPESVPSDFHGAFDFVLVDPPFITLEVWEKYAVTTRLLLKPGGRVLCTTIAENADMMRALLGLHANRYRPSIPNLVYQYSVYTNYSSDRLDALNPEVDDEDWTAASRDGRRADDVREIRESCAQIAKAYASRTWCNPIVPAGIASLLADAPVLVDAQQEYVDGGAPEAVPLCPAAELLTELRGLLNATKRCAEAANAPLLTAVRRRQAGGEAAAAADARAATALDAADSAVSDLVAWLSSHGASAAAALAEAPEAFACSVVQDRFRTAAIAAIVARARGEGLRDMAAYNEFQVSSKQHSAAVFRQSGLVMDRIKALKRDAAASG